MIDVAIAFKAVGWSLAFPCPIEYSRRPGSINIIKIKFKGGIASNPGSTHISDSYAENIPPTEEVIITAWAPKLLSISKRGLGLKKPVMKGADIFQRMLAW